MEQSLEITVRWATTDDFEVIAQYNCELASESEQKRLHLDVVRAGVRAILNDAAKGRYMVACAGGQIVGQMMHTREWSDWRNGEIWWLQSVYVAKAFRRMGVFQRLLAAIRAAAAGEVGVIGLRLYVEQENSRAIETYLRSEFTETGYTVMELLPQESVEGQRAGS
jgi:GNAT superfamily N-acetyltransferase